VGALVVVGVAPAIVATMTVECSHSTAIKLLSAWIWLDRVLRPTPFYSTVGPENLVSHWFLVFFVGFGWFGKPYCKALLV